MEKTRREAMVAVERHYETGKPCKHGHIALRWTVDGTCTECRRTLYTYPQSKAAREKFQAAFNLKRATFSAALKNKEKGINQ